MEFRANLRQPLVFSDGLSEQYLRFAHEGVFFVPGVAGEDGADHAAGVAVFVHVEHEVLEAAVVPALDVAAEGGYAAHQGHGELVFPVGPLPAQLFSDAGGGEFGRLHGDGYAGGENGVEKLAGRAQEGEVAAVKPLAFGGVAGQIAEGEAVVPFGVGEDFGEEGDFGHDAFEDGGGAFVAEVVFFADHADGASAVGEGDEPHPYVAVLGVDADEVFVAVEFGRGDAVVDVGEVHLADDGLQRQLPVHQARQGAVEAAGVEHEAGFHFVGFAIFALHGEHDGLAFVVEAFDGFAVAHGHAAFFGFVDQEFVEIGALDVEGGIVARAEFVEKVERGVAVAP